MRLLVSNEPFSRPQAGPNIDWIEAEKLNATTIVDAFFISSSTKIIYFGRQRLTIYYCGNILRRIRTPTVHPSVLLYMIYLLESY